MSVGSREEEAEVSADVAETGLCVEIEMESELELELGLELEEEEEDDDELEEELEVEFEELFLFRMFPEREINEVAEEPPLEDTRGVVAGLFPAREVAGLPETSEFSSPIPILFLIRSLLLYSNMLIHFPNARSDLFILRPSTILSPLFVEPSARSEPARSIMCSFAVRTSASTLRVRARLCTRTVSTAWEREETTLRSVGAIFLRELPSRMIAWSCATVRISTSVTPAM